MHGNGDECVGVVNETLMVRADCNFYPYSAGELLTIPDYISVPDSDGDNL